MLTSQNFKHVLQNGVQLKNCKKIKMRANVYMLTLKWKYFNNDISIYVLIVFQKKQIEISIDSIKGKYYFTEHFRRELSQIIWNVCKDLSELTEYRYDFFFKRIDLRIAPKYIIQDLQKYQKRLEEKEYLQHEKNVILKEVENEIRIATLPACAKTDVYFQKIILYGYDGIELSNLLEQEGYINRTYTRSISFPNAVCEFKWENIENPTYNREEELVKIWYRVLKKFEYSCEIIFNE